MMSRESEKGFCVLSRTTNLSTEFKIKSLSPRCEPNCIKKHVHSGGNQTSQSKIKSGCIYHDSVSAGVIFMLDVTTLPMKSLAQDYNFHEPPCHGIDRNVSKVDCKIQRREHICLG